MIVTPLVGSLVLFWMVDAEGIIGANLQILMNDPYLSVKSTKSLKLLIAVLDHLILLSILKSFLISLSIRFPLYGFNLKI